MPSPYDISALDLRHAPLQSPPIPDIGVYTIAPSARVLIPEMDFLFRSILRVLSKNPPPFACTVDMGRGSCATIPISELESFAARGASNCGITGVGVARERRGAPSAYKRDERLDATEPWGVETFCRVQGTEGGVYKIEAAHLRETVVAHVAECFSAMGSLVEAVAGAVTGARSVIETMAVVRVGSLEALAELDSDPLASRWHEHLGVDSYRWQFVVLVVLEEAGAAGAPRQPSSQSAEASGQASSRSAEVAHFSEAHEEVPFLRIVAELEANQIESIVVDMARGEVLFLRIAAELEASQIEWVVNMVWGGGERAYELVLEVWGGVAEGNGLVLEVWGGFGMAYELVLAAMARRLSSQVENAQPR
ncbi:hypothetical protein BU17DRAFT_67392 [Hysterangium stoloniferum]|nr:hypothetical protein BU17DRAFT_67392 [Hysterangium stoloniferum]